MGALPWTPEKWAAHSGPPTWHTFDHHPASLDENGATTLVLDGAVVRRIQLGRELRALRLSARMSIEEAATRLYFSPSKLSRIENGQHGIDPHAVRSALDLYGDASRWDELIELCLQSQERGWWRAFGFDDKGYVPLEAEATRARDFALTIVPGLLQTADYARAIFCAAAQPRSTAWIDNAVAVRMMRQQRLTSTDKPLDLVAVVDESVLHRPIGGRDVMRAQLAHLIEAAELPTVTLQVLPMGVPGGLLISAAFTVLSFDHLDVPDIGYVEHPMGAAHIDKEEQVEKATLAFDRLRSLALSPADTVDLIRQVAEQM